ncbi:MAG TPA: hypothetical protein VMR96_01875 [Solirubrobacterales bacterium]|nr:hypothetical protein [Solirubrobacterales bacterium]
MNAGSPRSAHQLIADTVGLYRRYPLIFPALAAAVIVPYDAVVLGTTGSGALTESSLSAGVGFLLTVIEWCLVGPLISALHVHAVREAREGHTPRLAPVARQGLRVLPVVAAASIISGLGIFAGYLALVIPGVILTLRWIVVAQSAAIDHQGWIPALRRSAELTDGRYGHVFVFVIYVGLITFVPIYLGSLGFEDNPTSAVSLLVGLLVQVFSLSFGALATALLYFDLRTRSKSVAIGARTGPGLIEGDSSQADHPRDPRSYTDQTRPKGWYIDPRSPKRMVYWGATDPPDWGATARTPRKVRRAWEESQDR